jgi:hypothetical protein
VEEEEDAFQILEAREVAGKGKGRAN